VSLEEFEERARVAEERAAALERQVARLELDEALREAIGVELARRGVAGPRRVDADSVLRLARAVGVEPRDFLEVPVAVEAVARAFPRVFG
jgi:hypothetical protein